MEILYLADENVLQITMFSLFAVFVELLLVFLVAWAILFAIRFVSSLKG